MRHQAITVAAGLLCQLLACSSAQAGFTGNVGGFSEYVFRGIAAEGGAAIQGGIDYAGASGLVGGIWASNTALFGGSELDLYAGYLHHFSDKIAVDAFALYYVLPEDREQPPFPGVSDDLDTLELGINLYAGPVKAQLYYSPDFVATGKDSYYHSLAYTHAVTDSIAVTAQAGYTHGRGAEIAFGDQYLDYSLAVAKTIREGLVFSLTVVDTNLTASELAQGTDDDPKVWVGIKQTFAF